MNGLVQVLGVLEQRWRGVLLAVFLAFALMLLLRWALILLGFGAFRRKPAPNGGSPGEPARLWEYFLTQFIAKTINEFRHLLAMLIFLLFSGAVVLAMLPGLIDGDVASMGDGLQVVAASLGGLIGSIIGYYFGEQSGRASRVRDSDESSGEAVQEAGGAAGDEITMVRPPEPPAAPRDNRD